MKWLPALLVLSYAMACAPAKSPPPPRGARACPTEMAKVGEYCIDRYEAYVVEVDSAGREKPHSPYEAVDGLEVRAKSEPGIVPQGYISQVQAKAACESAHKRLCTGTEFVFACSGGAPGARYPYGGTKRKERACNEGKGSSMVRYFGQNPSKWTGAQFNDPRLNHWEGGLAKTASFPECVSSFGVYDCVGNLHEWVDEVDPQGHGRFRGGFYGDAEYNGPGCQYVTRAHMPTYHDYSTGFRCCLTP